MCESGYCFDNMGPSETVYNFIPAWAMLRLTLNAYFNHCYYSKTALQNGVGFPHSKRYFHRYALSELCSNSMISPLQKSKAVINLDCTRHIYMSVHLVLYLPCMVSFLISFVYRVTRSNKPWRHVKYLIHLQHCSMSLLDIHSCIHSLQHSLPRNKELGGRHT